MANVSASDVKTLRERTGAGMMDCKKALVEVDGDIDKAIELLRTRGTAMAEKKAGRATREGVVTAYVHPGDKLAVLVEVNCETDFVARTDGFKEFAHNLAMHVAASAPLVVMREELAAEDVERERNIYRKQALEAGKPEKIIDKIVNGKLEKYFSEVCLLEQPYVKDSDVTVSEYIKDQIAQFGENISVRRFVRLRLGE
jgi:elongation factor Ts